MKSLAVASLVTLVGCATGTGGAAPAPAPTVRVDTVRVVDTVAAAPAVPAEALNAGRFDNGKMWTFEYPPMEYFREAYDFAPDSAWFTRARLSALRLPNCTASFVSPRGLVLTNHHCARGSVSQVSQPGERILDEGFYAALPAEERPVEGLYLDQLLRVVDVTADLDTVPAARRQQAEEAIVERVTQQFRAEAPEIHVELVELWNAAKVKAYVFRRFTDVRLVFAPELQLGYYGGDSDNFTFPRYALDMSFYRVYENDEPYRPEFFFPWTDEGVEDGDAVFVIGNPGSTSRLETVAQLEFRRDVNDRAILHLLTTRIDALEGFYEESPEEAEALGLRNLIASLLNTEKLFVGRNEALNDRVIMARRADTERQFRDAVMNDPQLRERYGDLWAEMARIQQGKQRLGGEFGAFLAITSSALSSAIERRAFLGYQYVAARGQGAPQAQVSEIANQLRAVGQQPAALQLRFLTNRLQDLEWYLGDTSGVVRSVLQGRTPEETAQSILQQSALSDSTRAVAALDTDALTGSDPAVRMMEALAGPFAAYQRSFGALNQEETDVALAIGRAWFDVYGTSEPPDATFSLRMADGKVANYEYNGTVAPVYTTFYGLYDHYYSYGPGTEWDLPPRWLNPPDTFDLATPLNFVSTADIVGGNSGSPVINVDLELVGVAFDGNIESLSGDFIFLPTENRAVSVDARGMLEALEHIYRASRLVEELTAGAR